MKNSLFISEKEKRILASLYKIGKSGVAEISKDTLVNRTTLYPFLEKLLTKGLISKIKIEDKTIYQPISQTEFLRWIKRQEKDAQTQSSELSQWIRKQTKNEGATLASEIKYFEGLEGVKNLYEDSWRNNEGKIIYCITDYKNAYAKMGKFFKEEYFPERIKHGIHIKNILPESKVGKKEKTIAKQLLREMKFIKILEDLDIEINIYDNKTSIVAFDEKNPSAILIKNEKISKAMKNIFEYLWKTK
ncbi:MAG: transcriptional regulator TrmB [uncultured bacterium]|nr:MAG: transcriptional regulator TrmB [uncultured bacterium]HBR71582.1 hypothetical protein [Candidatus Moranbacteria bacterium]